MNHAGTARRTSKMRVKTYHCDSVPAAMRLAKIELGHDAVFLGAQPAGLGSPPQGRLEVTFAIAAPPPRADGEQGAAESELDAETVCALLEAVRRHGGGRKTPGPAPARNGPPVVSPPHWRRFVRTPEGLTAPSPADPRREGDPRQAARWSRVEQIKLDAAGRAPLALPQALPTPLLRQIYEGLSANEVDPVLAARLVRNLVPEAREGASCGKLLQRLDEDIAALCVLEDELGVRGAHPAVAALVGPPGSGKTSCVAKMAYRAARLRKCRVHLISLDQARLGSVEPLQAYASALGTPITVVDRCAELAAVLRRIREGETSGCVDLVLIDTPGYTAAEWLWARQAAAAIEAAGDIDVHLVLNAAAKPADLQRTAGRYGAFHPRKLLFARLDETETHGAILSESVRCRLPLSFFSTGQRVPEDLIPASEEFLLNLARPRGLRNASGKGVGSGVGGGGLAGAGLGPGRAS